MNRRSLLQSLIAFGSVCAVGCGDESGGVSSDFPTSSSGQQLVAGAGNLVGRVDNSPFSVGVTSDGTLIHVFVCDGARAQYFQGTLNQGRADLVSLSGDLLSVRLDGDVASGTLTLSDGPHSFTARPALGGQGFHWAELEIQGTNYRGGWVLTGVNSEAGVVVERATFPALTAQPLQSAPAEVAALLTSVRDIVIGPSPDLPPLVPVGKLVLSPSSLKLAVGQTQGITATFKGINVNRYTQWTSRNTQIPVVSVDSSGKVRALASGIAVVDAKFSPFTASVVVTVVSSPGE